MDDNSWGIDMDLLTWRKPKKTAIVFLTGNLIFLSLTFYSFLTLTSLFLFYLCVVGICINLMHKLLSDGEQNEEIDDNIKYEYISAETIQNAVIFVYTKTNNIIEYLKSVASIKEFSKLANFILLSILFIILTQILSTFAFCWIAFSLLFVLPKVYSMKKKKIDTIHELIMKKFDGIFGKLFKRTLKNEHLKQD